MRCIDKMKIDTHIHTHYSWDCLTKLEEVRKKCLKKGIIPCITDHNTIQGALEYRKKYGEDSCIIGEEVTTKQGEVIGLFVKKEVKPHLDVNTTVEKLKKQGALIIIPHPFDRLRKKKLDYDINKLNKKHKIDFIEVFNSRTFFDLDNRKALLFTQKNKKKENYFAIVGSDGHTIYEIGNSYIEFPGTKFNINKKEDFLKNFKNTKGIIYHTKKSTMLVHAITKSVKILKLNREHKRK